MMAGAFTARVLADSRVRSPRRWRYRGNPPGRSGALALCLLDDITGRSDRLLLSKSPPNN